jgi:hypothetical protein
MLTIRLLVFQVDAATQERTIRDVKEQDVRFLELPPFPIHGPEMPMDTLNHCESIFRKKTKAMGDVMNDPALDVDTMMPHDFLSRPRRRKR